MENAAPIYVRPAGTERPLQTSPRPQFSSSGSCDFSDGELNAENILFIRSKSVATAHAKYCDMMFANARP